VAQTSSGSWSSNLEVRPRSQAGELATLERLSLPYGNDVELGEAAKTYPCWPARNGTRL
jgi:hypothetical protein